MPFAVQMLVPLASLLSALKPDEILNNAGHLAVWVAAGIIFAECGLLIGFFLPGDSLLFVVGLFVGNGAIGTPLWATCLILFIAAFAGNLLGYWIGLRAGPALFRRENSRIFKKKYIDHTEEFFNRYGAAAIILGRFIAIVRTFITVLAGAGKMDFRRFALYSAIGAALWTISLTVLGYLIGNVPVIKNNLEYAIILIVIVSVVPIVIHRLKARRDAKHAA
ncbi:MAG: VTT domain-containing protein [Thermoleophilia bacterium]